MRTETATPIVPKFLQRCSNDEFTPPPLNEVERVAARSSARAIEEASERLRMSVAEYTESRRGIATGLRSINQANGEEFFAVPDEASLDDEAASESLGGDQLIIDVQTHYFASRPASQGNRDLIRMLYPLYGLTGGKALQGSGSRLHRIPALRLPRERHGCGRIEFGTWAHR